MVDLCGGKEIPLGNFLSQKIKGKGFPLWAFHIFRIWGKFWIPPIIPLGGPSARDGKAERHVGQGSHWHGQEKQQAGACREMRATQRC